MDENKVKPETIPSAEAAPELPAGAGKPWTTPHFRALQLGQTAYTYNIFTDGSTNLS